MKIYEFQKNSLEKVVVEITTYQDRGYLNIRVWFDASKGQNTDWRPSHKGITLSIDLLPELKKSIDLAIEFLDSDERDIGKDNPDD